MLGVVGVVLAVPASIGFFQQGGRPLAFFILVLSVALIMVSVALYVVQTRPPFTIVAYKSLLNITDAAGKQAVYRKTLTLRPNYPGLGLYEHRPFSYDGARAALRVDAGVTIARIVVKASDHYVTVQFRNTPAKGERVTTWIEQDLVSTFTGTTESLTFTIVAPTRSVDIEIVLVRPIDTTKVRLTRQYGGQTIQLPVGEVEAHRIAWKRSNTVRRVPYGEYELQWEHV